MDPVQQRTIRIIGLGMIAGIDALAALDASEHQALDVARIQAHRADVITGRITITAILGMLTIEANHHRLIIAHPGQTLKQSDRAAITAKKMAGEHEFDKKCKTTYGKENGLIARERAVPKIAVNIGWRQQIRQQHDRPQQRTANYQRDHGKSPDCIFVRFTAIRISRRQRLGIPQALLADGLAQSLINGLYH